jgi:hypothetical protein
LTEGRTAGGWPIRLWVMTLVLAVAAPVLRPGYVLSYDAVAVPRQSFLPDSFGIGELLPRAVPAEAVTVALTQLIEGQWVQKVLLVACLLLAGLGAARLVPTTRPLVAAVAATAYVWNPYVAERLVLGHWWLILGYGCLPWLVVWSARVARRERGALPLCIVLVGLGSLVPSAGLLSCLVVLVVVVACSGWSPVRPAALRVGAVCGVLVLLEAPWWLPGVLHHGPTAPGSVALFAARAEPGMGVVGSILSLGGVWNADVVPDSRGLPVAMVGVVVVLFGAVYGLRPLRERLPDGEAAGLLVLGAVGLLLAVWTATPWGSDLLEHLSGVFPGAGLLRDAQKFVALWALVLSLLVALAAERLAVRVKDSTGARAVLVGALLVPIVVLPDLAWGVAGRLVPVALPPAWSDARAELLASDEPGDVLVLPWGAFRAYTFNGGRTSLDPAPRWIPRTSVVDGRLIVTTLPTGVVATTGSETDRSAQVTALLGAGAPGAAALAKLGIGWVVIERGTPGSVPEGFLDGTTVVMSDPDLELRRVPGTIEVTRWTSPLVEGLVVVVDLLALALVAAAGLVVLRTRE